LTNLARLEITIGAASDVGSVREHNEDAFVVGDLDSGKVIDLAAAWQANTDRGPVLVVCDGMGGVVGGEVASELAAQVIWREMKNTGATHDPEVFARLLRRAARLAHPHVQARARAARHGHDRVGSRHRR
jgi:serine/threonine protein phosphatase PrpC